MKYINTLGDLMNGYINVFKPRGLTSHDVVKKVKKILKVKKVGHTGTLDPNASGVLPICIGKATRTSEYLLNADKTYIGELTLGISTDTQDVEGSVLNYSDKKVKEKDIINVFNQYRGEIYQTPPMYSALKFKGKKLYELARTGVEVEREKRKIYIYDIDVLNIQDNEKILFSVKCSRGTYIRTLCNDIGEDLGTYGYMSYLIRTVVGSFKISDAVSLETIQKKSEMNKIYDILYPIDYPLSDIEPIYVPNFYYNQLANGMPIDIDVIDTKNINTRGDILRVYCKDTFIGIGRVIKVNERVVLKLDKVLM